MACPIPTIKVGDIFPTNQSGDVEVIEYRGNTEIKIRFSDGTERWTSASPLLRGQLYNTGSNKYIGKVYMSNLYGEMRVIKYESYGNVTVEFSDGTQKKTQMLYVKKGCVRKPSRKPKKIVKPENRRKFTIEEIMQSE